MKGWSLTLISLLFALLNCHPNDSVQPIHGEGLTGTWLLYETGYSPGAGYMINKIPAKPR